MTTGIGGWRAEAPPTVQLTLAIGLWNTGGAGRITCRLGVIRPGESMQFIGEGDTQVADSGEMVVLPLKMTLTFDQPGTYWAIGEFDGKRVVEVPFTVTCRPSADGSNRLEKTAQVQTAPAPTPVQRSLGTPGLH